VSARKLLVFGVLLVALTVGPAVVGQSGQMAGASDSGGLINQLPGFAPVRAAIVKAEGVEKLNQNLVSQLQAEPNSRFVDSCASEPGESNDSPAAAACTYGDSAASQVMVLYGDSYVEQWLPAFDALGKQDHFKVVAYVRYGCPFAEVTARDYLNSIDPGCALFRQNVIAAINAMVPPPSLTLLSELQMSVEQAANGSTMPYKTWANGIRATLEKLKARPLGVLLGTPIAANFPNQCLGQHLTHIQDCATPAPQAFSVTRDRDDLSAVTAGHGVPLDLSSLFCAQRCPEVINDQFVFADDVHVNKTYAQQLTTALGSLVACIGTQVPPAQNPPGGVLQLLLGGKPSSSLTAACRAANSAPYNL
jgi:hypothetical protein